LPLQQEIAEAAHAAEDKYKMKNPDSSNWTDRNAEEWVRKAVKKTEDRLVAELRKHLPVADPKLSKAFLEEVKVHYEKFDEPEMLQEKLYMLATSAMPPKMMVKWLQRWNSSSAIRDAHRFPKASFADSKFPDWLNRATWWAQVRYLHEVVFNVYLRSD
jgi:hypothetical protein